jgi:hypothetical protein
LLYEKVFMCRARQYAVDQQRARAEFHRLKDKYGLN